MISKWTFSMKLYLWVRLDFNSSVRFAALAFGYINGESDCTSILSSVNIPALKSFLIPLPELSLHNPPTKIKNIKIIR